MEPARTTRPTGEILVVWTIFGLLCLAVFVTYARLDGIYHFHQHGIPGGAGRVLVSLNYPIAIAAIGVVAVLLERGAPRALGAASIALCALIPFTVDQDDLDARLVNVVPALGVALAVYLTIRARPTTGLAPRRPLDCIRVVIAAVLLLIAIPWYFAELGFYAPDPIYADERIPNDPLPAVHVGEHHGMDGVLLALTALLLTRIARSRPAQALLAVMFVYGTGNALQDGWLEQVQKRGWTDVGIPSITVPSLLEWLVLFAFAAGVYALIRAREGPAARGAAYPAAVPGPMPPR